MTTPNPVEKRILKAWAHIEGFAKVVSGVELPFKVKKIYISNVHLAPQEMAVRVERFTDLEPDSMIVVDVIVEIDGRSVGIFSTVYLDKELVPNMWSQAVDEFTIEAEDVLNSDDIKEDLQESIEETLKGVSQVLVLILVVGALVERESGA